MRCVLLDEMRTSDDSVLQCLHNLSCRCVHLMISRLRRVLQCVAVCCSVLLNEMSTSDDKQALQCGAVCGIVWRCVAVCCSVLQCFAVCCGVCCCM